MPPTPVPDPEVLRRALRPQRPPDLPELVLLTAHPGSGLSRLGDAPPYWAYLWAGGAALARHVLDNPALVAGRRVLDFGAGSGVLAIAAARAGAAQVLAVEADGWGRMVCALNAKENGVEVEVLAGLPDSRVDLVLAGDVFYGAEVAARSLPLLEQMAAGGARVLVGDPGRTDLPLNRLRLLASHPVRDMGDAPHAPLRPGGVYELLLERECHD